MLILDVSLVLGWGVWLAVGRRAFKGVAIWLRGMLLL